MKYKTTEIDPEQTAGEIAKLVRGIGGRQFSQAWDEQGLLSRIHFVLETEHGSLPVIFRSNAYHVLMWLRENSTPRYATPEHAARVAWRQTKHLIEGMIISIESGVADPHTLLMGYATPDGHRTFGEVLKEKGAERLLALAVDDVLLLPGEVG